MVAEPMWCDLFVIVDDVCFRWREVTAMAACLDGQKNTVQDEAYDDQENGFHERMRAFGGAVGEIRQDQGQHPERDEHTEESLGALQTAGLLVMAPAAKQDRKSVV